MNGVRVDRRTVLLAAVSLLAGCAMGRKPPPSPIPVPPPPPKPTIIQGRVIATPELNPDRNGRASPIVMRLFELRALAAFASADFFSLYDRDRDTLGGDLLAREEIELRPGDVREFELTLQPDTQYLGVIAAFRDLDHSRWRSSVPVIANQTTLLRIRLESRSVSIDSR